MNTLTKAGIAAAIVVGASALIYFLAGDSGETPRSPRSDRTAEETETVRVPLDEVAPPVVGSIDVEGTVKDETGKSLERIAVRCQRVTGGPSAPKLEAVANTETASDGEFGFSDLTPGTYEFSASATGYASASQRLTIAEGKTTPSIDLILSSGLTIRGTIRDPLGKPVAGAKVGAFLERAEKDAPLEDRLLILLQFQEMKSEPGITTVSDEAGAYTIIGLRHDDYRIVVSASGFSPAEKRYVMAGSDGVDFDLAIGGELVGSVVDLGGKPIAGALVRVFRSSGTQDLIDKIQEMALPPLDYRETDSTGSFAFDSLGGESEYRVHAAAAGHQEREIQKVKVETGQRAQLEIALDPGNTIRGIVYAPSGTALEGARCRVHPASGAQPANPPSDFDDDSILTDASGEFVFDTLASGSHRLVVSHELYATFIESRAQPSEEVLTIHLTEGSAISGLIFDARTKDPIPGAKVTVHDLGGEQKEGLSDASGAYFVRGISVQPRGTTNLNIEAEGYQRISNHKVEVEEGAVTAAQDFYLERNGTVLGRVVDGNGRPLEGVRISARRTHDTNAVVVNIGQMTTSAADGSFAVQQVEAGDETFLEGSHRNFLNSRSETFSIEPGQEVAGVELMMKIGGSVTGRVIDEQGAPIAEAIVGARDDVMIEVNPASLANKVYTDAEGRFTLGRLEAGDLTLISAAKGFLTVEVTGLEVVEGQTAPSVEIRMTAGAHIAGTVRNSLGEPIGGARVTVIDTSAGMKKLTTSTDTNGKYRFDELGYYPVEVEAEAPGYSKIRLFEQPVNHEGIDFVLEAFGSIRGRVYAQSGEALRAFSVSPRLVDVDGTPKARVPSRTIQNESGDFSFDELQPGIYQVVIGAPGYAPAQLENVVVHSSRVTELPVTYLGEGGRLSGFVFDARTGEPIAGVTATVVGGTRHFLPKAETQPDPPRMRRDQATSGPDGSFEILGLASAQVTLKFEHRSYLEQVIRDIQTGTTGLEVELSAGGTIEGKVIIGGEGKTASGYQILLASEGRGHDRRVVTDGRGNYSITGLPSGQYIIRVTDFGRANPGGPPMPIETAPAYKVNVVEGEVTVLDISLE